MTIEVGSPALPPAGDNEDNLLVDRPRVRQFTIGIDRVMPGKFPAAFRVTRQSYYVYPIRKERAGADVLWSSFICFAVRSPRALRIASGSLCITSKALAAKGYHTTSPNSFDQTDVIYTAGTTVPGVKQLFQEARKAAEAEELRKRKESKPVYGSRF